MDVNNVKSSKIKKEKKFNEPYFVYDSFSDILYTRVYGVLYTVE